MIPWLVTSLAACAGVILRGGLENPVWAIVAANLAGLLTLLVVQKIERTPAIKRWLRGPLRTWVVSALLFGGTLWTLVPELREGRRLLVLFLPLIFCAGLITPWVFGPLQDGLIRRIQRKARGFTDSAPHVKS